MGKRSPSSSSDRSRSPKRRREDTSDEDDRRRRSRRDRSDSHDRRRRSAGSRSRSRSSSSDRSRLRDRRRTRSDSRERRRSPPRRGAQQQQQRGRDGRVNGRNGGGSGGGEGPQPAEAPAPPPERKPLAAGPAGGVYIPPFKLAQMMAEIQDKESAQYQRMTWDALRKSINGLINKVNTDNIKYLLPEVLSENLVRGQGIFCRSIMKSQMASPAFSPVYAALVAVLNTKFPELGELLLHRVVTQFKRSFKRNDKPVCTAALRFIAHLINQQVVHEALGFEVLLVLLEQPSDDSVEVALGFLKECGTVLKDMNSRMMAMVTDRLRSINAEGEGIERRTQVLIDAFFQQQRAAVAAEKRGEGAPPVPPGLDLVDPEDQITHNLDLDDQLETKMHLDVFKEDPLYRQHEEEYAAIRREILGEEEEEEEEEGAAGGSEEEGSEEEEEEGAPGGGGGGGAGGAIRDVTETDLVNLRRTIYLTLMSALDFEEAGHKLLKMGIPEGHEGELCTMIIECCSQEKTFNKYYALLAERFSKLKREYSENFCDCFVRQYEFIHRLETNKLRNVAKLFAHLLSTDAMPWSVLSVIRLTEEDTSSSSRIFIKILFQELAEVMGLVSLNARLNNSECAPWFGGIFPRDTARNMRFAINFFTSIGLGGLTDGMRAALRDLPALLAAQQAAAAAAARGGGASSSSDTSSSDTSSSSGSDSSSSDSDSDSDSESDTSSSSDSGSSGGSSSDDSGGSSSDEEDGGRRRGGGGDRRRAALPRAPPGGDKEAERERRDGRERQEDRREEGREPREDGRRDERDRGGRAGGGDGERRRAGSRERRRSRSPRRDDRRRR